jgi:hypothetical protein
VSKKPSRELSHETGNFDILKTPPITEKVAIVLPQTVQFFIAMIACSLNESARRRMAHLEDEVETLREMVKQATGKDRLTFTAEQRRRLALSGKELTPKERRACCHLVTPETILKWFRDLAARKYDSTTKRGPGRRRKPGEIRALVIRLASENLTWGYTKIRDALRTGLKIEIGRTTVANILAEAGIVPAPERNRKRTWKQFLRMHWETLYACDFFAVEALAVFGTVRYMVFFVMRIKTRAVEIAGIRVDPGGEWMKQIARNLIDPVDGFLRGATHLVHDGDPLFRGAFADILKSGGVEGVKIPAQSPNCNPHAERFVRTIRNECLDHFVIFGERHLRRLVKEFVEHYQRERFHQGLDGRLLEPRVAPANDNGRGQRIGRRSRLGGLLNFYQREAA